MNPKTVFFDQANNLRSGWRFLIFALAFTLAGLFVGTLTLVVLEGAFDISVRGSARFLVINGLASLAVALVVGWLCARFLERLPFRSLGASLTPGWFVQLILGLAAGGVTFAVAAAIAMIAGGLSFIQNNDAPLLAVGSTLLISFLIFAAAAAFEEALFRGYMLQTFVRADMTLFAVLLTSTLFATVHNANPNATLLSWTNTFLAGIWFAVAYLKTRTLWMPFGLHLAWNWVQGSVFGIEVSGLKDIIQAPVLREIDNGPAWLTGGEYGVEGGLACTFGLILSTLAIYFLPVATADEDMLALTSASGPSHT
jgi:membrane protease YdiL (CAAX protease family)